MGVYEIRPRSIVYLFSGGKDSSAALVLTRDVVRDYAMKNNVRVYMLYIAIPGNTHPLNSFCAASIMYWHKEHYGFEPVFLARNRLFQEYMAKYGLQKGPQRWCYIEFKEKVIREFHRRIPKPALYINGMKPSDSRHRSEIITDEFQLINGADMRFWAWHPLFSISSDEEVLNILRKHEEFKCVAKLYEKYGDSLNCIICPYKSRKKILQYHFAEGLNIIHDYMKLVMRSKYFLKKYQPPDRSILSYIEVDV